MNDYDDHLDFAKELAHEAGEIMLKYFLAENLGLEVKGDNTPVTLADTEINSLVISKVKARFPDHGVLGEEESYNLDSEGLWICDPLDGTSLFAQGLSGWVFSLAYVENGMTKIGVVYDPLLQRLLWAAEGKGAFENERKLTLTDVVPQRTLQVNSWTAGGHTIVVFKNPEIESKIISAYIAHGGIFVSNGPVAHCLALVGAGRLDASVSSCINPWDLAAGSFIAGQAGAKVTDIFGKPVERWDKNVNGVLAAPPKIHALLLEILNPIIKDAELQ